MEITRGVATDFEGIYNTIPTKGFLDLRNRAHFGKGDGDPEMIKKELLRAAKMGNQWAIESLKENYGLTRWVSEGRQII